jgi:hypothetical protein
MWLQVDVQQQHVLFAALSARAANEDVLLPPTCQTVIITGNACTCF